MLIIIIVAIVGALIAGIVIYQEESIGPAFIAGGVALIGCGVIGLILAMLLGLIPGGSPNIVKQEITALKDNLGAEGSFFLGSGHIESEMYYFYMTRDPDGALRVKKIQDTGNCYIYEEGGTPYVQLEYEHSYLAPWFAVDV